MFGNPLMSKVILTCWSICTFCHLRAVWPWPQVPICLSYGMELPDTGMWGFLLPPNQIIPTGQSVKSFHQQTNKFSVPSGTPLSSVAINSWNVADSDNSFCQVWAFHQIVGRQLILEFGSKRWKLGDQDQGRNKEYHSSQYLILGTIRAGSSEKGG